MVCIQNLMGVAEHCTGDATDDLINRAHGDMHEANRNHMEAAALQASRQLNLFAPAVFSPLLNH